MAVSEIPAVPPGISPDALPGVDRVQPRRDEEVRDRREERRRRRRRRRPGAAQRPAQPPGGAPDCEGSGGDGPAADSPVGRLIDVRV